MIWLTCLCWFKTLAFYTSILLKRVGDYLKNSSIGNFGSWCILGFLCEVLFFLFSFLVQHSADVDLVQLFPNLDKVVFIDDDVVIQRDLSPLWEIDLGGKVNGAVETCKGDDDWVMSKHLRNYFNFSHPLISKNLNPDECAWAYGMNIFDLRAWRKTNIRDTYHTWLKEVSM